VLGLWEVQHERQVRLRRQQRPAEADAGGEREPGLSAQRRRPGLLERRRLLRVGADTRGSPPRRRRRRGRRPVGCGAAGARLRHDAGRSQEDETRGAGGGQGEALRGEALRAELRRLSGGACGGGPVRLRHEGSEDASGLGQRRPHGRLHRGGAREQGAVCRSRDKSRGRSGWFEAAPRSLQGERRGAAAKA
jgi:hypothetical protein